MAFSDFRIKAITFSANSRLFENVHALYNSRICEP